MATVPCPTCHGRGSDVTLTCPNCEGTCRDPYGDSPYSQCHECENGEAEYDICPRCGGEGQLEKDELNDWHENDQDDADQDDEDQDDEDQDDEDQDDADSSKR